MPPGFGNTCIFPIFPEGGTLANSAWPGSGSAQTGPRPWCSRPASAESAASPGLPCSVRVSLRTTPALAGIQVLGKRRKKGRERGRD